MTKILPPYHEPMSTILDCDLANDRVAELEAKLAAAEKQRAEQAEAKAAELERMLLIHWQHQHNLVYDTDPADGTSYDDWLSDLRVRAERKDER